MVFTDPPYGINIVSGNKVGGGNIAKTKEYSPVIGDDTTDTAKKAYEVLNKVHFTRQLTIKIPSGATFRVIGG